jgi:hypothetical protein
MGRISPHQNPAPKALAGRNRQMRAPRLLTYQLLEYSGSIFGGSNGNG